MSTALVEVRRRLMLGFLHLPERLREVEFKLCPLSCLVRLGKETRSGCADDSHWQRRQGSWSWLRREARRACHGGHSSSITGWIVLGTCNKKRKKS